MATQKKPTPPRRWEIDDLLALGKKGGVTYLQAIPVLILDEWLRQGQGAEVYIRTTALKKRLVESGLHLPFLKKGTSNITAALSSIQKDRNLTSPPLMKSKTSGGYWVNLEDYKDLLQEFRDIYLKEHLEDYKKLFPKGEWEGSKEGKATHVESEVQEEIQRLLAPVEQALRDRQQAVERLGKENKKLQVELQATLNNVKEAKDRTNSPLTAYTIEMLYPEIAKRCRHHFQAANYDEAILNAFKVIESKVREAAKLQPTDIGVTLMTDAFNQKSPRLVYSDVTAEQEGAMALFRGGIGCFKNPHSHRFVDIKDPIQTFEMLCFASTLCRIVDGIERKLP